MNSLTDGPSHRLGSVMALGALILAACASSSPPASHTALPTCAFNIGDTVQPTGSMGARVPELGQSVEGFADKATGGSSSIQIETSEDRVVTITSSKNASSPSVKTCQLPTTPSLPTTSAANPVVALWPGQTLADLQTDFTGTPHGPVAMAKAFAVDALGWPVDLPASPPMDPEGDTLPISVGAGNRRCHRKACPWTHPAIEVVMAQPFNDNLDVRAESNAQWAVREVWSSNLLTNLAVGQAVSPGDLIKVSVFTYSTAGGIQRHDQSVTVPDRTCAPIDLGTFTENLQGTAYPMHAGLAFGPDCGKPGLGWVSVFLLPKEVPQDALPPDRLAPSGAVTVAAVPVVFAPPSP